MAENDNSLSFGRKIFFLYPPAIIQNQVISQLAQEEFEVYVVKDEVKLRRVLQRFPDSVVFVGINERLKENAWEEWIRGVMTELSGVDIGIIASGADENIRKKYLEQIKVRCGYTVVKADINNVISQLIGTLNKVDAKGRRKYIRALISNEANTNVNLPMNGTFISGAIKDISVVGFSCSFREDPDLTKNVLFKDIQIRLQSQILKAEGIVFGSRMEGEDKNYVILFTNRIDSDVRTKIRKYIQSNLQSKMDTEFK